MAELDTKLRDAQLADIRRHIADYRADAARCQHIADRHHADAMAAEEMARRWETVHDAIRFGQVPHLDGTPAHPDDEHNVDHVPTPAEQQAALNRLSAIGRRLMTTEEVPW